MIEGILVYLLLIGIYLLMCSLSKVYKNNVFFIIGLMFVVFFVGFKDKISPDLERYALMYENYNELNYTAIEPVFIFFSYIFNKFGFSWVALSFIYSLLTILFIVLGIKNFFNNIMFAFLLFLFIPGFFLNMFVEMRQILAVSLTFYAFSLMNINGKKRLKNILFVLFSIITHYSAIVFWLLILILRKFLFKKFAIYKYILILIISFIIPFAGIEDALFKFFAERLSSFSYIPKIATYRMYFATYSTNFYWFLKTAFYTILGLFVSLFSNRFDPKYIVHLNLFIIGVAILNITVFIPEVSRITYYFLIYQIILIPSLTLIYKKDLKLLISYSLFLIFFLLFIKGLFYYSEEVKNYIFLNYKNVLLNSLIGQ